MRAGSPEEAGSLLVELAVAAALTAVAASALITLATVASGALRLVPADAPESATATLELGRAVRHARGLTVATASSAGLVRDDGRRVDVDVRDGIVIVADRAAATSRAVRFDRAVAALAYVGGDGSLAEAIGAPPPTGEALAEVTAVVLLDVDGVPVGVLALRGRPAP